MRVQIDQTGRDVLPGSVDHIPRARPIDAGLDSGDLAVFDCEVRLPGPTMRRVDHVSPGN